MKILIVGAGPAGLVAAHDLAVAGFKVDEDLLALALPEAVVMHCLPAVRDEEISASLLHGPRSAILHYNRNTARMANTIGGEPSTAGLFTTEM